MKSELITNVTPLGWHIACERIMVPTLLIYSNDNEKSTLLHIRNRQKKNHINITKNKKLTSDSGHTPSSHTETTTAQHPIHIYTKRATGQCTAHIYRYIATATLCAEEMHCGTSAATTQRTKCGIKNLFLCEL